MLLAYDNNRGGDSPIAYWRAMLGAKSRVWPPYLDDPAAMLEQGMDIRGWVAAGLLAASPPDLAVLEEQLVAAADARDWSLAYALAAHHTDPRGVRMFLEQVQQLGEDEVAVVGVCC